MPELHSIFKVPASSPPTLLSLGCGSYNSLGMAFAFKIGRGARVMNKKSMPPVNPL